MITNPEGSLKINGVKGELCLYLLFETFAPKQNLWYLRQKWYSFLKSNSVVWKVKMQKQTTLESFVLKWTVRRKQKIYSI